MLLFPEGVLMLNPTAHAVLRLVDGRRTLGEIVGELARSYDPAAAVRSEAESVDLSMDPGTDMGAHEAVSGSSTGSDPGLARAPAVSPVTGAAPDPAGAAVPGREAVIERDVIGFLRSLEARSWLLREPRPDHLTASAEPDAGGASRTERKEPSR
jgi:hypothetical protein